MDTSQQLPVNAGYCRKKFWLAFVILTGCCVAWIAFYTCYTSVGLGLQPNKDQTNKIQMNNSQIREVTSLSDHNCSRYVSHGNVATPGLSGLGNQMFYFAAALHVADLTGREVVLFHDHSVRTLTDAFDLNVRILKVVCQKYYFTESSFSFDANLEKSVVNNSEASNKSIDINGFFQSWRYLRFIKDRVRHHFNFRPDTRQVATKFLQSNIPPGWTKDFLRVGIHVRRGDFFSHLTYGFSVGTEAYFQKAMKYFVQKYGRIQFIVASVDKDWTKKFIHFNDSALANVTFSFDHTNVQDMAILSMCDHVIVSTGTFGWWSAWLAGGTTVYYANFPSRNSEFAKKLKREDYYPANWIPME